MESTPTSTELTDDVQKISDELKGLSKLASMFKRARNLHEKVTQVSVEISLLMPKPEETFFEIDDLIYPSYTMEPVTSKANISKDSCQVLADKWINIYIETLEYLTQYSFNFLCNNRQCLTTCIQIIENLSKEVDKKSMWHSVGRIISYCMKVPNILSTCVAIKIMRAVFKTNAASLMDSFRDHDIVQWLSNMLYVPQPKSLNKKKITSWISRQSEFILEQLNIDKIAKYLPCLEFSDTLNENLYETFSYHMVHLLHKNTPKAVDQLYRYFTSATDEPDKLKRLRSFFIGVNKEWNNQINSYATATERKGKRLMCVAIDEIMSCFSYYLDGSINDELFSCTEEQLKATIDECLGYHFKPYFSRNLSATVVTESHVSPILRENHCHASNEDDFFLEKFLCFDTYVKFLHLMEIIMTACKNCDEIFELEEDNDQCLKELCYSYHYTHFVWIIRALRNPSERVGVPWWLHALIKLCPSLIVKTECEYMLEDIVKMMKGEPLDEVTEEKLHFTINHSYCRSAEGSFELKFIEICQNFNEDGDCFLLDFFNDLFGYAIKIN